MSVTTTTFAPYQYITFYDVSIVLANCFFSLLHFIFPALQQHVEYSSSQSNGILQLNYCSVANLSSTEQYVALYGLPLVLVMVPFTTFTDIV